MGMLQNYEEADQNAEAGRYAVVMSLRNGSGFGKTHILTEAPNWLNAKGIYITYNQGQNLNADSERSAQAVILRLILVLAGYSPNECAAALSSEEGAPFLELSEDFLRRLFVHRTKDVGEIAICVDEASKLPHEAAQRTMSALSKLAAHFFEETHGMMCTILISSLSSETFRTVSDKSLIPWKVARPNHETLDFLAYLLPEVDKDRVKALANALGGGHMRSLVFVFKLHLQENMTASMMYLYNRMNQESGTNIVKNDLIAVHKHIIDCITSRDEIETPERIEEISDDKIAIPPCFIMKAFEDEPEAAEILGALYDSFNVYISPGKQLEEVGKQYNLFWAHLNLPVVPGRATVHIPVGCRDDRDWFKSLKFTRALVVNEEPLLMQRNKKGSKAKKIVATKVRPQVGYYYHPEISNHPWIDRLFVVWHPQDKEECIVMVQDKVNSSQFSEACEKLQLAADLLSQAHQITKVLLVVNVIGATEATRAQRTLTWPHVLIRGDDEVRSYYSASFANIVLYAWHRHELTDKNRQKTS